MNENISKAVAGLRPIELADAALFRAALRRQPRVSCECSFTNLFLWGEVYDSCFFEYEGRLFVYSKLEQVLQFPFGPFLPPEKLLEIAGLLQETGHTLHGYYDVPDDYLLQFPEVAVLFKVTGSEDYADYLYSVRHLTELTGSRLRKKRNLIKQFHEEYPVHRIEPITTANLELVRCLAGQLNGEQEQSRFIEEENLALERTWQFFDRPELQLEGILLFAGDAPVGFSLYSPLGDGVFDVHFEKADHHHKGAGQVVTQQMAAALNGRAALINREQDLGDPGLRQAKHSLDPLLLYRRSELVMHS